eukprot:gene15338-1666_t
MKLAAWPRRAGMVARRLPGTAAPRHGGSPARRLPGTVARASFAGGLPPGNPPRAPLRRYTPRADADADAEARSDGRDSPLAPPDAPVAGRDVVIIVDDVDAHGDARHAAETDAGDAARSLVDLALLQRAARVSVWFADDRGG